MSDIDNQTPFETIKELAKRNIVLEKRIDNLLEAVHVGVETFGKGSVYQDALEKDKQLRGDT